MTRENAKKWAELYTALAEGKTIQTMFFNSPNTWEWIDSQMPLVAVDVENYRIKPQPKTRRMTNVEVADWLRDCQQEHREYKSYGSSSVWYEYPYDYGKENEPCEDIHIRRNHGEWEEPIVVEE